MTDDEMVEELARAYNDLTPEQWSALDHEKHGPALKRLAIRDARAVLPLIRERENNAAREALDGLQLFARDCLHGKHGKLDDKTWDGWHHTWAAAGQHRATYYSKENPR